MAYEMILKCPLIPLSVFQTTTLCWSFPPFYQEAKAVNVLLYKLSPTLTRDSLNVQ